MNKKKGMSQILTLIVAASVLMMTALTLVFMTQGGLGNLFSSSQKQQCLNAIKGKCNTVGGSLTEPGACDEADIEPTQLQDRAYVSEAFDNGTVVCE